MITVNYCISVISGLSVCLDVPVWIQRDQIIFSCLTQSSVSFIKLQTVKNQKISTQSKIRDWRKEHEDVYSTVTIEFNRTGQQMCDVKMTHVFGFCRGCWSTGLSELKPLFCRALLAASLCFSANKHTQTQHMNTFVQYHSLLFIECTPSDGGLLQVFVTYEVSCVKPELWTWYMVLSSPRLSVCHLLSARCLLNSEKWNEISWIVFMDHHTEIPQLDL